MERIAILASGSGTNAQKLMEHFRDHPMAEVALVASDQPGAQVLQRAWDMGVMSHRFSGAHLKDGTLLRELQGCRIGLIVLAGFMRLVPAEFVAAYPERILNIHPALLPKFGGKGMYGMHVHRAVIAAGEQESGITIHYVNERYDEGEHLFQARCPVQPDDTPESLAKRVLGLEHEHYPRVVEEVLVVNSPRHGKSRPAR